MAKTALELGPEGWKKYFGKPKRTKKTAQRKEFGPPDVDPKLWLVPARKPPVGAKTALELGPEGWARYNPQRRRPRRWPKALRARAWRIARKAARVLREEFGAKRVVVFGSLAHQLWYSPRSDIDIAVWGIAPEIFFRAAARVDRVAKGFEIDVLDPDDCRPSVRQEIEEDGIDL
jgi:predicted nucleotidyltransferase